MIERFQSAVNRFDGLTCEVRTKFQNIKRYSEPEPKMEAQIEKQPESSGTKNTESDTKTQSETTSGNAKGEKTNTKRCKDKKKSIQSK